MGLYINRKKVTSTNINIGTDDKAVYINSPQGVVDTVADLPTDVYNAIYITKDTGHWYYYSEEDKAWIDGGVYEDDRNCVKLNSTTPQTIDSDLNKYGATIFNDATTFNDDIVVNGATTTRTLNVLGDEGFGISANVVDASSVKTNTIAVSDSTNIAVRILDNVAIDTGKGLTSNYVAISKELYLSNEAKINTYGKERIDVKIDDTTSQEIAYVSDLSSFESSTDIQLDIGNFNKNLLLKGLDVKPKYLQNGKLEGEYIPLMSDLPIVNHIFMAFNVGQHTLGYLSFEVYFPELITTKEKLIEVLGENLWSCNGMVSSTSTTSNMCYLLYRIRNLTSDNLIYVDVFSLEYKEFSEDIECNVLQIMVNGTIIYQS